MAKKISRRIVFTEVTGVELNTETGELESCIERVEGDLTREQAQKLIRKSKPDFQATSVNSHDTIYQMTLDDFIKHGELVKPATESK